MEELYCKKVVQDCHWTRTGQCIAEYAYNCAANCTSEQQRESSKREAAAEQAYCADAAEAEWGNDPY